MHEVPYTFSLCRNEPECIKMLLTDCVQCVTILQWKVISLTAVMASRRLVGRVVVRSFAHVGECPACGVAWSVRPGSVRGLCLSSEENLSRVSTRPPPSRQWHHGRLTGLKLTRSATTVATNHYQWVMYKAHGGSFRSQVVLVKDIHKVSPIHLCLISVVTL